MAQQDVICVKIEDKDIIKNKDIGSNLGLICNTLN